jgi:hypothetical protein
MERKKLIITVILIVLILGSLTAFFYPKRRVVGGLGGYIRPGQTSYREEFSCFGIKYDFCRTSLEDAGCALLCFGIVYDKKCFIEVNEGGIGTQKTETTCR